MKLADLLTKIFPATLFPDAEFHNDLTTALASSALKDVEIPDAAVKKHNEVYLTRAAAENDSDIAKSFKNKNWGYFADEIEKHLKKMVATMPEDFKTKYYAIKDEKDAIYERLNVVKEGIQHIAEKGQSEDVKTAAERHRKEVKEHKDKIAALEASIKAQSEEFASKEQGIKMSYALRSKLNDFMPKLDQNILNTQAKRDFLIDSTINSLQSQYLLEFDKENSSSINFLKKDRTDVYEGNQKVTLEQYIEKQLEPYVVKNNAGQQTSTAPAAKKIDLSPPPATDARARRFAAAGATA